MSTDYQPPSASVPFLRIHHDEEFEVYETEAPANACDRSLSDRSLLSEFFDQFFVPCWLLGRPKPASPKTVLSYTETIRWWGEATGDPPLTHITDLVVSEFIGSLLTARAGRIGQQLSPSTVAKHLRQLRTLLAQTGPRTSFTPRSQGILAHAPYVEVPSPPSIIRCGDFTDEEFARLLVASRVMTGPRLDGVEPAAWWNALLLLIYWTGLRKQTYLGLEWTMLVEDYFEIPCRIMKGGKPFVQYVHPEVVAAIEAIWTPRLLIFEFPHSDRWFHRQWQRLRNEAGLKGREYLYRSGHAVRKTHVTEIARDDQVAAQVSAGHKAFDTTTRFYVNRRVREDGDRQIRKEAILRMRSPSTFQPNRDEG